MRTIALGLAGLLAAGAALTATMEPAQAQFGVSVGFGSPGYYGAEDGYDDDEFGWGPAYRPETTFRPAYGFYGGVERPYPYGGYQAVGASPYGAGYGYDRSVVTTRRVVTTTPAYGYGG